MPAPQAGWPGSIPGGRIALFLLYPVIHRSCRLFCCVSLVLLLGYGWHCFVVSALLDDHGWINVVSTPDHHSRSSFHHWPPCKQNKCAFAKSIHVFGNYWTQSMISIDHEERIENKTYSSRDDDGDSIVDAIELKLSGSGIDSFLWKAIMMDHHQ